MISLFQHISQSASADAWQRFRLQAEELPRLVDMARALDLSVERDMASERSAPFVLIRDGERALCIVESSNHSPSPFSSEAEPYSVAFTDSRAAIREVHEWMNPHPEYASDAIAVEAGHPAPSMILLRNVERASWLTLECRILHSVQALNPLDLEGEPLFGAVSQTIHEVVAPDLCALRLESPSDFWPGKPADWIWIEAESGLQTIVPTLTPRLQRLLYRRERTMFIEDVSAAPDINVSAENLPHPFGSCFLLPLMSGDKPIGTLMLFYLRTLVPLPGETEAVELFRVELSNSLDRIRTHLRMQRMATVDGLTNLFNHRFFRDQLRTEFQRALRYANMMAVIMIDIDNFKGYNDTYGHLAGDRVLSETARTIRNAVRDIDFVARYGGEEFALILPEVDAAAGTLVAEKIRKAVEAQRFISDDGEAVGFITISLGVTDNTAAEGPDGLISRADRALYWVKRHGRNRVRMAMTESDD
jgi:diguanylate cyclase (GGDEF)-like protein